MLNKRFSKEIKLSTIISHTLVIAALTLLLSSCGNDTEKKPDVSEVKIQMVTQRLDKDLEAIDTTNIAGGLQALHSKYPEFLNFYLDTLMGLGIEGKFIDSNPGITKGMHAFLTYKDYRDLFDTVNKHYPDTKALDEQLASGFKYARHYFPEFKEPKVVYIVSLLNKWGAFTYENYLGIGLDMFLGSSYPFYRSVGIPDYMGPKLERNYIPVAAFRTIYESSYPFEANNRNLLNMMIQKGKELYYVSKVLPDAPEAQLLAYTQKQQEWCVQNEGVIFNFFIARNILYSTNWQEVLRYVNDAPESTGLPGSPGDVGSWIGLQIVKAYMKEHAEMSLKQLLEQPIDAQKFLQESKYKPK